MKQIELTQGQVALVDDDDFERVMSVGSWCVTDHGYATSGRVYLHRFILDAPDGVQVDHEDRDGLNCQKSNLRLATHSQNQRNKGKRADNTSGYKGVSWYRRSGNWHARIKVDGKSIHLGYFDTAEAAAAAYDTAARKHHGDFARTNTDLRLVVAA